MKNLNKKISAIALSSMVMFGGVVVSGVQAFADSNSICIGVSQQQKESLSKEKLEGYCKKYDYNIIKSFGKGEEAKKAAKKEARDYRAKNGKKIYGGVRSLNDDNAEKLIYKLWNFDHKLIPVEYQNEVFLIELAY